MFFQEGGRISDLNSPWNERKKPWYYPRPEDKEMVIVCALFTVCIIVLFVLIFTLSDMDNRT